MRVPKSELYRRPSFLYNFVLGGKLPEYATYLFTQEKLHRPHPLNHASVMLERPLSQFFLPHPLPPETLAMFICLRAEFAPLSGISMFRGPASSSKQANSDFFFAFPFSHFVVFLLLPTFLSFDPDWTLRLKSICISALKTSRFIFCATPPRSSLLEINF